MQTQTQTQTQKPTQTKNNDLPIRLLSRWLIFIAVAFLAFGLTGVRAVEFSRNALNASFEGRDIEVNGIISGLPQTNETGTRFQFDVQRSMLLLQHGATQELTKTPITLPAKISLSWYGGVFVGDQVDTALLRKPAKLQPGEQWKMTVRLKAPHGNSNPGGFDFELWLWDQGIQATGYVRTGANDTLPQRLAQTWQHPIAQWRDDVRDSIFERLSSTTENTNTNTNTNSVAFSASTRSSEAGVIAALVTGDQQSIDRADWDVFRTTGVAHLMSISGLHITMFAWVAVFVVGGLYKRSSRLCLAFPATHAALIGGVLLATLYAVFSGWGVPSQRTILMLTVVTSLRLSGKRWPWPTVWMLTCAVVTLLDPWALLQAGFWLSFVAVGILFATDKRQHNSTYPTTNQDRIEVAQNQQNEPLIGARFGGLPNFGIRIPSWYKLHKLQQGLVAIKGKLWASTREQFIITMALTPLSLLLFGQVSVVGLLANALAIPWVTLVITPLAMLGMLFSPLWDLAALAMHGLNLYLALLATLPFATVSMATPPLMISILGIFGGFLLAMPWPWSLRLLGLPMLLTVIFWQAPRPEAGQFELLAADIGQGNGVIVRTASHTLVYDAGPRFSTDSDAGQRVMVPLLKRTDERVDTVMLSHRDTDHSGGVKTVLAAHANASFISSIESTHDLQAMRPAKRCVAGQRWQWDGVDFTVLHPTAADYDTNQKPNAMSCVLRISNAKHSALLVGDIEAAQEARLVESQTSVPSSVFKNNPLKSTILLVPHHGSKTSSSAEFLDAVQPQIAVVQAGYRNRFGHPATSVLSRYAERNINVIDTARCGAMRWSSAAPVEWQCQREMVKRYWHYQSP